MNEIICEDLMKITQIIVEIWAHLLLRRSLKIGQLRYALLLILHRRGYCSQLPSYQV